MLTPGLALDEHVSICIHEQSYLFHLCVWEVLSEERGPHETHSLLRKCGHCCPLVVPSHFIQGTTCPRIPLSSNDGRIQGSRFKVCVCLSVIIPALLYGLETVALHERHVNRLQSFVGRCLRVILGLSLWEKYNHTEVGQTTASVSCSFRPQTTFLAPYLPLT